METKTKRNGAKTGKKEVKERLTQKIVGEANELGRIEIQFLNMNKVIPDQLQPRKTYNEAKLKGLADSISQHGVLQPITVRKSGTKYIIVMGERRYRASKIAGKKTIPAIVKMYEKSDVLEIQIIENLQRQDVEATEEAEAIAFLSERYTSTEIAKKLGRGENFVRQRLKLAGLIEGFKHFVRSGEMTITLGIAVALFEPEEQQMMLENLNGRYNAHHINQMIKKQTYDLTKAPFNLKDKKLIPQIGACVLCPFNAANQGNLFGNDGMICTKSTCYEAKKMKSFINLMERAKLEKILLIPNIRKYWLNDENNQIVISQMEKKGLTIYLLDDVEILEKPIKPTTKSIQEQYHWKEFTNKELKEQLKEALQDFSDEIKMFNEAEKNGFSKGLYFDTDSYRSHDIFVKIDKKEKAESENHTIPLDKRSMKDCTPEEQIIKINRREIRKKQLENNKQFEETVKMIRDTNYINIKKALSVDEMVAFSITLYENNISYYEQKEHFKDFFGDISNLDKIELVERFKQNFKKETFHKLIRFILTKQVHFGESNQTNNSTNISFYRAMQGYYKAKITEIENAYTQKRNEREKRLKERISKLEKQVKMLSV